MEIQVENQVESQGQDRERMSATLYHPEAPADAVDSTLYSALPLWWEIREVAVNVLLLLLLVPWLELTCHRGAQAALAPTNNNQATITTTDASDSSSNATEYTTRHDVFQATRGNYCRL